MTKNLLLLLLTLFTFQYSFCQKKGIETKFQKFNKKNIIKKKDTVKKKDSITTTVITIDVSKPHENSVEHSDNEKRLVSKIETLFH